VVHAGKIEPGEAYMPITVKRFLSEPLVQFLVLGSLLFFLTSYIRQRKESQSHEIVVDNQRVNMMIVNYQSQTGSLPNKHQLDAVIENYIREEISYREAKKMGLDVDDEIVRRRLSQKFDFLQMDLAEFPTPLEAELLAFYKKNPGLFESAPTVSFTHIYFSTDHSTDSLAKQNARIVLQRLKSSHLKRAPEMGDRFPLQYDYTDQSELDVRQNFGDTPILDTLFGGNENGWLGPVQSGYGWHLIFITKRDTTKETPFASIREEVKAKWTAAAKADQNKKLFERISEKYNIKREYLGTK